MDTSEEAKLHSRLEQQSNLICMLKQRLDNTLSDLENSKRAHSTSQGQLEQVQMSLAVEIKQRHQLEERFRILASNHEEMIKIKDEYKSEVKRLQDSTGSVTKMKSELERKWAESDKQWAESLQAQKCREESIELELSRIVDERDTVIRERGELAAVVEKERREVRDWRKKHQIAQSEITSLKKNYTALSSQNTEKGRALESVRSQLHQLRLELQEEKRLVKVAEERVEMLETETRQREQAYTEREVELSKDAAIVALKKKLEEWKKLHESLAKEYLAFKSHSAELLAAEKKLNERLRHLLD